MKVFGICPQTGQIVLEYCEKKLGELVLHTLGDLLLHLGSNLPQELQLNALADIAEGLGYIHKQDIVHGYIKSHNILVCGETGHESQRKRSLIRCSLCARKVYFTGHIQYRLSYTVDPVLKHHFYDEISIEQP